MGNSKTKPPKLKHYAQPNINEASEKLFLYFSRIDLKPRKVKLMTDSVNNFQFTCESIRNKFAFKKTYNKPFYIVSSSKL